MKQLGHILKFEFKNTIRSKTLIVLTVVGILAIAIGLSFPRISQIINKPGDNTSSEQPAEKEKVALIDRSGDDAQAMLSYFSVAMPQYEFELATDEAAVKTAVNDGAYHAAFLIESPLKYQYIVKNAGMMDMTTQQVDQMLLSKYRTEALQQAGMTQEQSESLLNTQVTNETVSVGKDQTQNFFYTYILIFLLYFAIILYGNLVSQGVATEKSSRAMELLITSTKPTNLIFGKVFGIGLAGISQMVLLLGSAFIFYHLNAPFWEGNMVVQSVFAMPLSILLYTVLFFLLGFFIYAFLFAAFSSLASKLEEVNMLVTPVMMTFVVCFMITMFSVGSGNVDNMLMKVCSFIPLTSPMAMFTRIAMGDVATWEILVSIVILAVSTIGVGYLSAKIYRVGVLLYGAAPKPKDIFRLLKNASQAEKAMKKAK